MKYRIIKLLVLFVLILSVFSYCEEKKVLPENGGGDSIEVKKTQLLFRVVNTENKPVKDAFIVAYRERLPFYNYINEGTTDVNGVIQITETYNSAKGYFTIIHKDYEPQEINIDIIHSIDNEYEVKLTPRVNLRIMSYNIFYGFRNLGSNKDDFFNWVKSIYDPDIFFFQEIYDWSDAYFQQFAKSYGHSYTVSLRQRGFSSGISSKKPITNIRKVEMPKILHHGYIYAETYGLNLFVIHLTPYEVNDAGNIYKIDRNNEIRIILNDASAYKDKPAIISGDFNAFNERDNTVYGSGYKYAGKDFTTTNLCIENGFYDSYSILHSRYKNSVPVNTIINETQPGYRVDYIMVNEPLKAKSIFSDIIQSRFTDRASDHYPLIYTFEANQH